MESPSRPRSTRDCIRSRLKPEAEERPRHHPELLGQAIVGGRYAVGAVLAAVIAGDGPKAASTSLLLITAAGVDIDEVLASRRSLPSLSAPAALLKGTQGGRPMAAQT